ncbi:hypothetical protein FHS43_003218 [Streptosporangium becharense]|uniref:Uncharacterized protein n=1 Tax=Streptosporangium becharense TaxID=1816182 RepID=A0A7W9MF64_9ACTN|nr:hypothetical protein [Streptosporangium becharense]MBB2911938.1 hypothetical protein [Streptosporangium becharense]MBB5818485.1 hypothetical protein [Streptosporangium becharense]
MGSLLGGLALQWGFFVGLGAIASFWTSPWAIAVAPGVMAVMLPVGLVLGRIDGHRGWCWFLRSLDAVEIADGLSQLFPLLVAFLFSRLLRPFLSLLRPLSRLSAPLRRLLAPFRRLLPALRWFVHWSPGSAHSSSHPEETADGR